MRRLRRHLQSVALAIWRKAYISKFKNYIQDTTELTKAKSLFGPKLKPIINDESGIFS